MAFTKITAAGIGSTETVTLDGLSVINNGSFGGNLTVSGVLTYEDVTNVDSVGVITARSGVLVGSGITLSKDGDVFFTGIATGNGSGLTSLNASNLGSGTVPTARLGSGTASSSTFLRGDSTFQTVNTDLVSDTSPQLGGLLDGNGNTANFTANNTGLGLPIGTDANEPSAGSYKGYIRYNDDDDVIYYSNGTAWKKVSPVVPSISAITGQIVAGGVSTLTLSGTGFLSSNLVVNFTQSSDSIDVNVTVTPSSDTAASVTVPSTVYSNVTATNVVSVKVTNSDGGVSGAVNSTAVALPSGGTITTSGSYRIHTFTSTAYFVLNHTTAVEYLVIAGGGGTGARRHGGGGGAGGYRTNVSGQASGGASSAEAALSLNPNTYTVTIGAGGASNTGNQNTNSGATNGSNSTFSSITSLGGGIGSSYNINGVDGGSGGGGGSSNQANQYLGGSGTSGQGSDGGDGGYPMNAGAGGGGGGSAAVGGNASGSNGSQTGGNGGAGTSSNITGSAVTRAGGGGGGGDSSGTGGTGANGGGNGANGSGNPTSGTANTGGGAGGGGSDGRTAPSGGSGIVIVRYLIS